MLMMPIFLVNILLQKYRLPLLLLFFPFKCAATKAWTTSTAWKWRTWCLCMTCCWRCWMPTSCTAPVCLASPPSKSPGTRGRPLLGRTAPVAAPQIPGLPAALKVEVNRSSRIRMRMQWIFTALHKMSSQDWWDVYSAERRTLWTLIGET